MADNTKQTQHIEIRNKRATFEYEILERYVAGIVLVGTEIKSIRMGKASLVDSFCSFVNGELWCHGMHIAEYVLGTCNNHVSRRDRKLLLQRRELRKLEKKIKEGGLTVIGLKVFLTSKGLAKLEIGLCRGKKLYDKRESIKQRETQRSLDRMMRH